MKSFIQKLVLIFVITGSGIAIAGSDNQRKSPDNAEVYIIAPEDGATVGKTFTVKFGLKGMGVAPAGVDKPDTGHHHLLIDGKSLPEAGVPMGDIVKHFGKGQTETELTLPEGQHTLQLILGDMNHIPHYPMVVSKKITITVE
ncbi:DUF4399 domain-containing protein [Aliikangiella sp. G2MR2-5]|uniref:DUF4399 domain-containing protein n=1 Tax=Aliikangiella sp. G2MR2-5 TaxID=2788943 RepID=UPI0018AB00C8|nr:DUF4399 domain-containing protein [Aliikangiella sp. G2MR2-5]